MGGCPSCGRESCETRWLVNAAAEQAKQHSELAKGGSYEPPRAVHAPRSNGSCEIAQTPSAPSSTPDEGCSSHRNRGIAEVPEARFRGSSPMRMPITRPPHPSASGPRSMSTTPSRPLLTSLALMSVFLGSWADPAHAAPVCAAPVPGALRSACLISRRLRGWKDRRLMPGT